eukprot:gene53077-64838_t
MPTGAFMQLRLGGHWGKADLCAGNELDSQCTGMLASKTLTGHLVRGVVAFVLLYGAIDQLKAQPWLSLLA